MSEGPLSRSPFCPFAILLACLIRVFIGLRLLGPPRTTAAAGRLLRGFVLGVVPFLLGRRLA